MLCIPVTRPHINMHGIATSLTAMAFFLCALLLLRRMKGDVFWVILWYFGHQLFPYFLFLFKWHTISSDLLLRFDFVSCNCAVLVPLSLQRIWVKVFLVAVLGLHVTVLTLFNTFPSFFVGKFQTTKTYKCIHKWMPEFFLNAISVSQP